MQMSKFISFALFLGLLVVSCGPETSNSSEEQETREMKNSEEQSTPTQPKANLLDGNWEANFVEGVPGTMEEMYPQGLPNVTFDTGEGRVSGNSGCNNFTGSFSVDGNTITWEGELGSTRMACPNMDGEKAFLSALRKSTSYSVTDRGQTLNLIADDITGSIGTLTLSRVNE